MTPTLVPLFPVPKDKAIHPLATDSTWTDSVWQFKGLAPGTPPNRSWFAWDFEMPDGSLFSEPAWDNWREPLKIFVWSVLADPPELGSPPRITTVRKHYTYLRILITWMLEKGYCALTELDYAAQQRFLRDMAQRNGRRGRDSLQGMTLASFHHTLQTLFLQGIKYPTLRIAEPPPRDRMWSRNRKDRIPYTPDEIAVPLVLGAVRLIQTPASDVIALRSLAQAAYEARVDAGVKTHDEASRAIVPAVAEAGFAFSKIPGEDGPWYSKPVTSNDQIMRLVDRMYDAAFIIISYLVGLRASEILGLEPGCVVQERSLDQTEEFTFIKGRIFKTASSEEGSPHQWIAPDIAERAIYVLEQLSANLRAKSGRRNLCLVSGGHGMPCPKARISIITLQTIIGRINSRFAPFIDLPRYKGKPWKHSTHQGRKTFARFVGRKDRTGLYALKEHLGHRSVIMTDQAYAGTDPELVSLIGHTILEEMAWALAEAYTAPRLAGEAGKRISAGSQFRGRIVDEDALSYAKARLKDTNLTFEPCYFGNCFYRRHQSACRGDENGPNVLLRTQSTCVSCPNFVVAPKHRLIWEDRRKRLLAVLECGELDPDLQEDLKHQVVMCDKILNDLQGPPLQRVLKMTRRTVSNQYQAAKERTKNKLEQALERLVKGMPSNNVVKRRGSRLNLSSLALEAGVSRPGIYANHREFVDRLKEAKHSSKIMPKTIITADDKIDELRAKIRILECKIQQLATNNALLLDRIQTAERQ